MTENIITDLYLIKLLDPTFVSYDELVNGGLGRDEKEGRDRLSKGGITACQPQANRNRGEVGFTGPDQFSHTLSS